MELTYHLEPKADESPLGYYRRLGAANGLRNWKEMASLAKASPSRSGLLSRPEHIAASYGLPLPWTTAVSQREEALKALRGLHRNQHDAVCPACLREDMYLRMGWEHAYVTACPKHETQLVERCPNCMAFLSITREHLHQCHCGQDIAELPAPAALSVHVWLSGLLMGHRGNAPSAQLHVPDLTDVSALDLSELVRTLCLYFDPTSAPPRRNAANPGSVNEAVEFLAPLRSLLSDWPASYEAHIAKRIASGRDDARTLKSLLGPWLKHLLPVTTDGALRAFLTPVLRVASAQFDGVIGLEGSQDIDDLRYLRLKTAASHAQMTVPTLRRAIAAQQIDFRVRRFGTKGKVYEVQREDLERLMQARSCWLSEAAACRVLGVTPKVLGNMATAGLVDADFDWVKDVCKGGPVRASSLTQLQETLFAHQAPAAAGGDVIAFADLTSRRLGDNTAIQNLMRAIQSGEVMAQGIAATVGALRYRLSEVRRFFGTPMLEAGLSVSQLAKLTGWKHESIDHWIEHGLLESLSIVLRGQPCRVVMPAQLLAFQRTYMPVADVAKAIGSRSSFMARRLEQIGVIPGKATAAGTQRGMLVRVADVLALAMTTANLGKLAARDGRAGRKRSGCKQPAAMSAPITATEDTASLAGLASSMSAVEDACTAARHG
jgi:hypothetical protein